MTGNRVVANSKKANDGEHSSYLFRHKMCVCFQAEIVRLFVVRSLKALRDRSFDQPELMHEES